MIRHPELTLFSVDIGLTSATETDAVERHRGYHYTSGIQSANCSGAIALSNNQLRDWRRLDTYAITVLWIRGSILDAGLAHRFVSRVNKTSSVYVQPNKPSMY